MEIWVLTAEGASHRINQEHVAAGMAEIYPDRIYYFLEESS